MTLPVLSICTSRPEEASRVFTAAARCASWNGAAGISVRRTCCSLIQATLRANHAKAERTSEVLANCVVEAGLRLCGTLADLPGMVKRITQRAACFIAEFRAKFGTKFGACCGINCARPRRRGLGLRIR